MEEQKRAPTSGNSTFTNKRRRREEDETEIIIDGKTRYSCPKCDLATNILGNFNKHVQSHESKQEFTCPYCDFSSNKMNGIAIHLKRSHNTGQALSSEELLELEEDSDLTCPPAESLTMPAAAINKATEGDKVHHEVVELTDDDEEPILSRPTEFVFEHVQKPTQQQQEIDEQPVKTLHNIAVQTEVLEDDERFSQLSLEMLKKGEKSSQIKVTKLRTEIEEKLRFLEAHKALYYRERVKTLTSRKVELILLATKLDKESAELANLKKEQEKVESDFEAAVIKQSFFSSILEELDAAPGRVRLLHPDEASELKDSIRALLLKLKEADMRLSLIMERKKVLEEETWMERLVKIY